MQIRIQTMPHSIALMREIAPMALSKIAQAELGCAVWSDPSHTWFVAYDNDNDINPIGMCAAREGKGMYHQYCHDFVLPVYRGKGIYRMLFEKRVNWASGYPAKAACTKMSIGTYLLHGFVVTRETKNYSFVESF